MAGELILSEVATPSTPASGKEALWVSNDATPVLKRKNAAGTAFTIVEYGQAMPAGTTSVAPLQFTSGSNLTTAAAGALEYDGKVFYSSPIASNRGVAPSMHVMLLTADYTLSDIPSAQKAFNGSTNGAITVGAATSYMFEAVYLITNTGTTSHTWAVLFGGTATLTSGAMLAQGVTNTSSAVAAVSQGYTTDLTTAYVVTSASTSATENVTVKLSGIVRINAAGTFIPQVKASAQPNGTEKMLANSFFRMWPVGINTVASVGNWS